MPKLAELLSGILSDLTASRAVADAATRELAEAYRKDPILAQVPVPRVKIQDVTLKLRFAVGEHQTEEPTKFDEAGAATQWRKELTTGVVTNLLRDALQADRRRDQADDLAAAIIAPSSRVQFRLGESIKGRTQHTVEASVEHVLTALKKLPADVRRQLAPPDVLRRQLTQTVRTRLDDFSARLRAQEQAREGSRLKLDVLVRPVDLEKLPESAMQEITLSLSLDDVLLADPASAAGGEG